MRIREGDILFHKPTERWFFVKETTEFGVFLSSKICRVHVPWSLIKEFEVRDNIHDMERRSVQQYEL